MPFTQSWNVFLGESIWLLIAYNKINATLTKKKLSQVNQACRHLELELNGCLVAMIPSFVPKIHMTKICSPSCWIFLDYLKERHCLCASICLLQCPCIPGCWEGIQSSVNILWIETSGLISYKASKCVVWEAIFLRKLYLKLYIFQDREMWDLWIIIQSQNINVFDDLQQYSNFKLLEKYNWSQATSKS